MTIEKVFEMIDECLLELKDEKKQDNNEEHEVNGGMNTKVFIKKVDNTEDREERSYFWDEDEFLLSEYHLMYKKANEKEKEKIRKKIQRSISADITTSAKRAASVLTYIDLKLYKMVQPIELVDYDGKNTKNFKNLDLLRCKNRKLSLFVAQNIKADRSTIFYFYKLIKNLIKDKNYNSAMSIVTGIKCNRLNSKELKRINRITSGIEEYNYIQHELQKIDEKRSEYSLIPPIEIITKDVLDSNRNEMSTVASKKFYKIVEFFISIQSQELNCKSFRLEMAWLYSLHITQESELKEEEYEKSMDNLYLLL